MLCFMYFALEPFIQKAKYFVILAQLPPFLDFLSWDPVMGSRFGNPVMGLESGKLP